MICDERTELQAILRSDCRLRVKLMCHHIGMDLCLFVLWRLRLVVGTFLLSREGQSSRFGTKQLPTELYAPANGEGGN